MVKEKTPVFGVFGDVVRIELPSISKLERIRVVLDKPRFVTYKDGRNIKKPRMTYTPLELTQYKNKVGIYIIARNNNQILYIGSTTDLAGRVYSHKCLTENRDIKFVYFLEVSDKHDRLLFEMVYKFCYFGKGKGMIDYHARFGKTFQ